MLASVEVVRGDEDSRERPSKDARKAAREQRVVDALGFLSLMTMGWTTKATTIRW